MSAVRFRAVAFPFLLPSQPGNSTGFDKAGACFGTPRGTDGTILLATFDFLVLNAGTGTFSILSDILDPFEGLVYLWAGSQDISCGFEFSVVETATPMPKPATLLLLGSGLAGLVAMRRKRKKG